MSSLFELSDSPLCGFPSEGMATIDEVVNFLRLSKSTVQRLTTKGKLKARKLSERAIRYDAQEIRNFALAV